MNQEHAMPDFVPGLEQALRAAADEARMPVTTPPGHRAPRRTIFLGPMRVAAVVALLLVLTAAAAAAVTLWSPRVGDDVRGHPTLSTSMPPAAELNMVSILRRPQTESDRGRDTDRALRLLDPYTEGIRLGGVRAMGGGAILIPVARYEHRDQHGAALNDALCIFVPAGETDGGVGCFSQYDIAAGRAVLAVGGADSTDARPSTSDSSNGHFRRFVAHPGSAVFVGLVPDGVPKVRIGNVVAWVRGNAFEVEAPANSGTRAYW